MPVGGTSRHSFTGHYRLGEANRYPHAHHRDAYRQEEREKEKHGRGGTQYRATAASGN
jgi:hypothetical protein